MATRMNSHGYLKPDQMQALNAIFIVCFIPIFEKAIYPGLAKIGLTLTPLKRMGLGIFVCSLSFFIAALVQVSVASTCCADLDSEQLEVLHKEGSVAGCREDTCVSMWAQVPQYVVLTAAEVMFSISGLAFAFTEAPPSMKSIMASAWLLTVAAGNIVVIITAESSFFSSQAAEFLFFAIALVVVTLIHTAIAHRYTYVNYSPQGRTKLRDANALWAASDSEDDQLVAFHSGSSSSASSGPIDHASPTSSLLQDHHRSSHVSLPGLSRSSDSDLDSDDDDDDDLDPR